ncbi:MAG: hypothetical protein MZV70_05955 [Desulfobacterales bacterium]|nr:hypothetical protein [Desulfobacterales bacterium]
MKFYFETYGCQMNKAESSALETPVPGEGWDRAPTAERGPGAHQHLLRPDHRGGPGLGPHRPPRGPEAVAALHPGRHGLHGRAPEGGDEGPRSPPSTTSIGQLPEAGSLGPSSTPPARAVALGTCRESPAFSFAADPRRARATSGPSCPSCTAATISAATASFPTSAAARYPGRPRRSSARSIASRTPASGRSPCSARTSIPTGGGRGRRTLDFPGLLRLISAAISGRGRGGIRWIRFLSSHPKDLSDEAPGRHGRGRTVLPAHPPLPPARVRTASSPR